MAEYMIGSKKISYQSYGGGEKTLLFIHDLGGSSRDFDSTVAKFENLARIVTIDLCGHGQSSLPKEMTSIKTMAREVVAFIKDSYIGRVNVVGVGVGGAVALEAFDMAPELFYRFVFLETFISKKSRAVYGDNIRPFENKDKDAVFRNTFKRWVPANRDDLFIFANEFNGKEILRVSSNGMLFVYGDRNKGMAITKELMDLPTYSNVEIITVKNAGKWILENNYDRVVLIIKRFIIDGSSDFTLDGAVEGEPELPTIDINDLMYLQ